ncbi:Ff.00g074960.m01.CDS01 [Fusarium sp. VM40]|nr:Ff.00g074960.m01.CDS01 [Fusarium sp. VM40]
MITLLSPHYKAQEVTKGDLVIASTALGFTIGFGWLTVWKAIKQTTGIYRRHGRRVFRNAFAFYFTILTTWALQVQFLLQIIVNRCGILLTHKNKAYRLKVLVGILITAVNISVYCIWIPARLQISERYIHINEWWDRCEKGIYLIVDGCLNFYFIHIVRMNLIVHGLTKYRRLTHFNMFIIGFSLSMDVLIIAMMSLRNTFVYMQFHPLAYIVKLHIEMAMADLIGKIARDKHCGVIAEGTFSSTVSDGAYHLEDRMATESQTRLAEGRRGCNISKPRRMFRSYSRRTGEFQRDLPEP